VSPDCQADTALELPLGEVGVGDGNLVGLVLIGGRVCPANEDLRLGRSFLAARLATQSDEG
jgi:hypothetical protein